MKRLILALAFVLLPVVAVAQAPPVGLDYEVQVLIAATGMTVTKAIPRATVTCNIIPTALVLPIVNPTGVEWSDDVNSAPGLPRICRAPLGTFFSTLPAASGYVATVTTIDTTVTPNLVSIVSAVSNPFDVAKARPAARTGLVVR